MYQFPIGVLLDSFNTDIPTALKKANQVGATGIQVFATTGEMSPENLVGNKKREFLDMVKSNGLTISALCGDRGNHSDWRYYRESIVRSNLCIALEMPGVCAQRIRQR